MWSHRYLLLGRVLPVFPTPGCPMIITLIGFCLGISPIFLYSVDVMANGVWTTRLDITFMLKQQKDDKKYGEMQIFVKFTDNPFVV